MKIKYRITVIIYLAFIVLKTNAQNTTFNNVAIGTDGPAYGVKIKTNLPGYNGGWARFFSVSDQSGGQDYISLGTYGDMINGVTGFNRSYIGRNWEDTFIDFSSNGNVGIGTKNPSAKLSILGGISKLTLTGIDGTFDNVIKYGYKSDLESGTSMANRWHGIDATITAGNANDNKLKFRLYPGGFSNAIPVDVLTLQGNGNVGIGTTNPRGKLEISGNSAVYSDFASYSGTTINNILPNGKEPTLIVNESPSGNLQYAVGGQVTYRGGLSFGKGGPGIYSINPNPAGSSYYGELRFHTTYWNGTDYNNSDRMVIKLDGNVGIGTTNPTSKLTVAGNINSREVKVSVDAGADFVFEKDYALPSLQEVEKFVNENKHLPEIASAKEMQKEGINLSEMNIKLLQKIEELTLYVIEQQKLITQQAKELESHKVMLAKIDQIEKTVAKMNTANEK
nr:tail fiber protein [uncultured Flavobacterium sp.]